MKFDRVVAHANGLLLFLLLKVRGRKILGRPVVVGRLPNISGAGQVQLGDRLSFRGVVARSRLSAKKGATLRIGDRTAIENGVSISAHMSISIGRNCLIADGVTIMDSNYHAIDEGSQIEIAAIAIGDNVWIGHGAIVLPGVSIGSHSVVAAGSIVTKTIREKTVVGGNPARPIRDVIASDTFIREP